MSAAPSSLPSVAAVSFPPAPTAGMDVPRARRHRGRRVLVGALLTAGLVVGVTVALARMDRALPSVDRAAIWTGKVTRGTLVRAVRGGGALVSEEVRWVTAPCPGRVERLPLLPGVVVTPDTVLVELRNPEIDQAAEAAASALRVAEARRSSLALTLESDRLSHESLVAQLRSDLTLARLEAEADGALETRGQLAGISAQRSAAKARELASRVELEDRRALVLAKAARAQILALEAELVVLRAQERLQREKLGALQVQAGQGGVLERLGDEQPLRLGQRLEAGAPVARVANPAKLKAEIHVAEAEAKEIQIGQRARIDFRGVFVDGSVVRVDPAVRGGAVTVDVALVGALPSGARPGLSLDAIVTIDELHDALHVGRPVGVVAGATGSVFKLDGDEYAVRVPVRFGRSSVDAIEIVEGLKEGDVVVLSDTASWDPAPRVALAGRQQ